MTTKIFAKQALTSNGWQQNVLISVNQGLVTCIQAASAKVDAHYSVDVLLPALSNLHSHSFQRAMAGLTETRASGLSKNDFWSWRQIMYQFLQELTPEDIQAIASQVQMEMLESGYAACAEFHYVHHHSTGQHYQNLSELSQRVFQAAKLTGIGYTHLPVLYSYAGLNQTDLNANQLRFGCNVDVFSSLFDDIKSNLVTLPADAKLGIAPHSLRAVDKEGLELVNTLCPSGPIHIHIAEQVAEVNEVKQAYGIPPVAWLLNNAKVDSRWCLVHATHINKDEVVGLAKANAVVGLCPLTEANLGDGIFNATEFLEHGGAIGIGSDSNVKISLSEELRLLEISQRLRDQRRVVLVSEAIRSNGRYLYEQTLRGGSQALGRNSGALEVGKLADLVALNTEHENLIGLVGDQLLDAWIFSSDDDIVTDVWAAGRHVVTDGRHKARDKISADFKQTIIRLRATI
ncbi:MAG: formimidoylglutamate deiminase [Gammaproteobacteria bacterium]|nr:formimidoylglutamate deiminase [Gammaproteobacteria bacterium]